MKAIRTSLASRQTLFPGSSRLPTISGGSGKGKLRRRSSSRLDRRLIGPGKTATRASRFDILGVVGPIQTLEFQDCRLAYRIDGAGPPLLMIQGIGAHGLGWNPQVEI